MNNKSNKLKKKTNEKQLYENLTRTFSY